MKKYLFLMLSFYSCWIYAESDLWGKIYKVETHEWIDDQQLVADLMQADIVLLGEQHDICTHHAAEYKLLQQTKEHLKNGTVVMEMLDSDQQKAVQDVQKWLLQGGNTTLRRLPQKIEWNSAWHWDGYGHIVHHIIRSSTLLLAGNPSKKQLVQANTFIPKGVYASNPQVRTTLAQLIKNHHTNQNIGMINQQQFKDFTMANTLLRAPKPAWLIAGAIHSSKQLGVPLFLQDTHYQGHYKVIIFVDSQSTLDVSHADYIWYLPSSVNAIPCTQS